MAKSNVNKLKYPLWLIISFYLLTVLGPIILIMIEGFQAPDERGGIGFKLTFGVLSTAIIAWVFIKKLLVDKIETKLITKQTSLQHDYSIDCGDTNKIRYLWYENELTLTLFSLVSILLYGGLICIVLIAVAEALIQIKGIIMLIIIMYAVAYTIKFVYIIAKRNGDYNG